jgi:hypothetical protein|tara:strand:- start:266 stop:904 length:639 start_codon:yes stop_codon:yes gene_type:complete
MLSALLTVTVVIGIILIGLLLFVVGKLTWLESATTSLLTKIDLTPEKNKPQEIQMDPYFYGLTGQDLWSCLTGGDTSLATPLELEEIRPRYGIALIKSLVKFIQDGIDVGNDEISENSLFELEKLVFTSRGQIGIWLPSNRVQNLRNLGAKIANYPEQKSEKEENELKNTAIEIMRKEIKLEICNLCELLQLRHGEDIASDVIKVLSANLAS